MRVLFFVTGDEVTASTRYRVLELLPYLRKEGFTCETLSLAQMSKRIPGPDFVAHIVSVLILTLKCLRYDVLYVQKIPLPSFYIRILKIVAVDPIIYDFDDALYTDPQWLESRDSSRGKYLPNTLESVTTVIAGSPVLADYAKQFSDDVYCLPTGIPEDDYKCRKDDVEGGDVVIGWIGNPVNLHYLSSIEGQLATVLESHDSVELHIITSGDLPIVPLEERRGDDVIYQEWSPDKELDYLTQADIAIRPLFDDEWTRGKGGFTSVIQCMALKIPVVVTPVAMLEEIVEHGVSGFHVRRDDEWIEYLQILIDNPKKRLRMGKEAFKEVDSNGWWSENRANELINILEKTNK